MILIAAVRKYIELTTWVFPHVLMNEHKEIHFAKVLLLL